MRQQNLHQQPVYCNMPYAIILPYCNISLCNSQKNESTYHIALDFMGFLPPRGSLRHSYYDFERLKICSFRKQQVRQAERLHRPILDTFYRSELELSFTIVQHNLVYLNHIRKNKFISFFNSEKISKENGCLFKFHKMFKGPSFYYQKILHHKICRIVKYVVDYHQNLKYVLKKGDFP